MCAITEVLGGQPGMISGATGAIAVVIVVWVVQLHAAVVLLGRLQLLFGALGQGKFIRMMPHPVMLDFVNGPDIVIVLARMPHFQQPGVCIADRALRVMLGLVALATVINYLLPGLTEAAPSALLASRAVALLTNFLGIDAARSAISPRSRLLAQLPPS